VLKPGGAIAILEFTEPPEVCGDFYRWYFWQVFAEIGGLFPDTICLHILAKNPLLASSARQNSPRF